MSRKNLVFVLTALVMLMSLLCAACNDDPCDTCIPDPNAKKSGEWVPVYAPAVETRTPVEVKKVQATVQAVNKTVEKAADKVVAPIQNSVTIQNAAKVGSGNTNLQSVSEAQCKAQGKGWGCAGGSCYCTP